MIIDLSILGSNIGSIVTLVASIGVLYAGFKKVNIITLRLNKHERCINDSLEERKILMRAQKATLEAVSGIRCNGNVDDSIKEIDKYFMDELHEKIEF